MGQFVALNVEPSVKLQFKMQTPDRLLLLSSPPLEKQGESVKAVE